MLVVLLGFFCGFFVCFFKLCNLFSITMRELVLFSAYVHNKASGFLGLGSH